MQAASIQKALLYRHSAVRTWDSYALKGLPAVCFSPIGNEDIFGKRTGIFLKIKRR